MDLRSAACLADLSASTYKPNIIKNGFLRHYRYFGRLRSSALCCLERDLFKVLKCFCHHFCLVKLIWPFKRKLFCRKWNNFKFENSIYDWAKSKENFCCESVTVMLVVFVVAFRYTRRAKNFKIHSSNPADVTTASKG